MHKKAKITKKTYTTSQNDNITHLKKTSLQQTTLKNDKIEEEVFHLYNDVVFLRENLSSSLFTPQDVGCLEKVSGSKATDLVEQVIGELNLLSVQGADSAEVTTSAYTLSWFEVRNVFPFLSTQQQMDVPYLVKQKVQKCLSRLSNISIEQNTDTKSES